MSPVGTDPRVEWTLADLIVVLGRRRGWILSCLALCFMMSLLYGLCATRRYRATAEIEVQKESHGAFGLDNATADRSVTAVSDSFDDNLALQTEIGILESDEVTLDVIRRNGLESTPDYFGPHRSRFPVLERTEGELFFWQKPLEPLSTALADAPNRRYIALKIFAHHRNIAAVAGTHLIAISYADPDPRRAATVVDALLQSLSDAGFHARSSAAAQSAAWLSNQEADLKRQTDALDARAAALDRAAGDYGDDDAHNVVLARLDSLNTALSAAESNRIVRQAIWRAAASGDPELISSLSGNSSAGSSTQNAFALLQALRTQESQAEAQFSASANRYGENWPGVAEQRARVATLQKSIQEETGRLGERARNDYEISLQAENSARQAFEQQKDVASHITGTAVALRLAHQEADESRTLYTSLLGRLQQTGVLEGLHSGNFTVVSRPLIPAPDHPTSPSLPLLATMALGAGLATGCSFALLRELTDTAIHSAADLEALLDAPVLAVVPPVNRGLAWYRRILPMPNRAAHGLQTSSGSDLAIPAPHSPFIASLQCLRASLLISHSSRAPQVILVVDTGHSDLKRESVRSSESAPRSIALGLAAVLAQHGAPTLFLDADLRSAPDPGNSANPGLSEMLADESSPNLSEPFTALPLLSLLHAGARPPCPSELIASSRMASLLAVWRDQYSFVVIHGPAPSLAESLVLAQNSDAVLVVVRAAETTEKEILSAWHALSRQIPDHAVLGAIVEGTHAHA